MIKKYNKKLEEYFLEKDLEATNKLQEFTSNYYAKALIIYIIL